MLPPRNEQSFRQNRMRSCACLCMIGMLLPLFRKASFADAYPNDLLSKSNCWTELTVDEVIMNSKIKAAADSDDHHMRIQLAPSTSTDETYRWVDDSVNGARVEILSELPIQIPLQVVTTNANTDPDYQYAMDVMNGRGRFENGGGCDGKKRIAARSRDTVVVTIVESGAILLAAWAAGHEAVRLTPPLTFVTSTSSGENHESHHEAADHRHKDEPESKVDPQRALDESARLHTDLQEQMKERIKHVNQALVHEHGRPADHRDREKHFHGNEEEAHRVAREHLMANRHKVGVTTGTAKVAQKVNSLLRKSSPHHNRLSHDIRLLHAQTGLVSSNSYVMGAFFLMMVSACAVYSLRMCSRQRTRKGRRDL